MAFFATATGGVRVGVNTQWMSTEVCDLINGTEVVATWQVPANKTLCPSKGTQPHGCELPAAEALGKLRGGAVGLTFVIPAGGVLYAWHM